MNTLRLLIVEDNEQDLKACQDSVTRYQDEKKQNIDLVVCKSLNDAFNRLDNSFDGAIIDLKLAAHGDEGNQVIKKIEDFQFRIPIAILTGTPDNAVKCASSIGVFKKGEAKYADLLDTFRGIYNTGLTRIMGGRGEIQKTLSQVFQNMLPLHNRAWVAYGEHDATRTEKALLRHTLNYLLQLLDGDVENCFPEEVYLHPSPVKSLQTGSIVKRKSDNSFFAVLNPACDLVVRGNGNYKTERILLVEIDSENIVDQVKGIQNSKSEKELKRIQSCEHHHPESECYKGTLTSQKEMIERSVSGLFKNTHDLFHHWLPKTDFFTGGFLNFRKLDSMTKEDFNKNFDLSGIQISPSFIKDVVARFSSYYARQGQPDIDYKGIISKFTEPVVNKK
jgi:ActR/RegA family two-component response regulator